MHDLAVLPYCPLLSTGSAPISKARKFPNSQEGFTYQQAVATKATPQSTWRNAPVGPDPSSQVGSGRHQCRNSLEQLREHRGCGGAHGCRLPDSSHHWGLWAPTWEFLGAAQSAQGPRGNMHGPDSMPPAGPVGCLRQEFPRTIQAAHNMHRRQRGLSWQQCVS